MREEGKRWQEKAAKLHGLTRKAKFWRGAEDVEAGVVMWDVRCKPRLIYGSEVWACSSSSDEKKWSRFKKGQGGWCSWRFPGVVVRGELVWVKLKSEQHAKDLAYAGRLRAMAESRWPKLVAQAIREWRGIGSWVDYVEALVVGYWLEEAWEDLGGGRGDGSVRSRRVC